MGIGRADGAPRSEEAEEGSAFFMRLHPVSAPALGPPGSGQLSTAHPALLHGYLLFPSLGKAQPGQAASVGHSPQEPGDGSFPLRGPEHRPGTKRMGSGPGTRQHRAQGPCSHLRTARPFRGAYGSAHPPPTPPAVCAPHPGHHGKQREPETRVVAVRDGLGAAPQ